MYFYLLNREFGHNKLNEEIAADPLAGGVIKRGHQCGMLWGSSLAVGAESYRKFENKDHAIAAAVYTTQHILESFTETARSVNCRDITTANFFSKISMFIYMLFKAKRCFGLAERWAPEAIKSAIKGLSLEKIEFNSSPVSCASEVVKKLGGSDEEATMVAGFAGGIGLSGQACGALGAVIWIKTLKLCREEPRKSAFGDNPVSESIIEAFENEMGDKILCSDITGRKFKTIDEHTEFIKKGGCENVINILASA